MTTSNFASVKLNRAFVGEARREAELLHRSVGGQIEHWARLGRAIENAQGFSIERVRQTLQGDLKLEALSLAEQEAVATRTGGVPVAGSVPAADGVPVTGPDPDAVVEEPRLATYDLLNPWYFADAPHAVRGHLEAARRTTGFEEVVQGLDATTALYEARRCMSCGNCFECDNCYGVCPDNAVIKLGPGKRFVGFVSDDPDVVDLLIRSLLPVGAPPPEAEPVVPSASALEMVGASDSLLGDPASNAGAGAVVVAVGRGADRQAFITALARSWSPTKIGACSAWFPLRL